MLTALLFTIISCENRESPEPTEAITEAPTQNLSKYEADIALLNSEQFCLEFELVDHDYVYDCVIAKQDGKYIIIADDYNYPVILTITGSHSLDIKAKTYYEYTSELINYGTFNAFFGNLTLDSVGEDDNGNTIVTCDSAANKKVEFTYIDGEPKVMSIPYNSLPYSITFDLTKLSSDIPDNYLFDIPEDYEHKEPDFSL